MPEPPCAESCGWLGVPEAPEPGAGGWLDVRESPGLRAGRWRVVPEAPGPGSGNRIGVPETPERESASRIWLSESPGQGSGDIIFTREGPMRPIRWGDGTRWNDPNARWGFMLEPGHDGYVIPPPAPEDLSESKPHVSEGSWISGSQTCFVKNSRRAVELGGCLSRRGANQRDFESLRFKAETAASASAMPTGAKRSAK